MNSNNSGLNYKGLILISMMVFTIFSAYAVSKAETSSQYVFSQKEDAIFETLIENGYSVAGACGILGNISVENPKFEPDLTANNGNTYGLFQWTDVGDRRENLIKWCNNRLLYPNRMEGQLAFAMHELNGGDPQASKINDYLKNCDKAENAAEEFAAGFERCVGGTSNPDADGVYEGVIFPDLKGRTYQGLSKRKENARNYFEGYFREDIDDSVALDIQVVPTAGIIAEKEEDMERQLNITIPVNETSSEGLEWLYRLLCVVIGYMFGCILGISVIVRNVRQKEALHFDKGLPGLGTVLKHVGAKECLLSGAIDVLKFYTALLVIYFITGGALASEQILLTGIGVIIGNAFPFWRRFRGGMGLMVTTVFLCTYMPIWGYLCCLLGLIVALIFKSLPFGGISICIFAVPYAFFCKGIEGGIFITLALIIVLYKHYKFIIHFIGKEILHRHYTRRKHQIGYAG